MTTATKTASHYVVMGSDGMDGHITLHVADEMQDAIEWKELQSGPRTWEVWVVFTDASSERIG